jgi:hypothetical protein
MGTSIRHACVASAQMAKHAAVVEEILHVTNPERRGRNGRKKRSYDHS